MLYQITAHVHIERHDGVNVDVQLPTFLLDGDIQGIVSVDHARRIARDLINRLLTGTPSAVFIDVVERPEPEPPGWVIVRNNSSKQGDLSQLSATGPLTESEAEGEMTDLNERAWDDPTAEFAWVAAVQLKQLEPDTDDDAGEIS